MLMLPTAADFELRVFEGGSVLSSSAVSVGLNSTFLSLSALCSPLEIKSGKVSTEVANFPLQTPLQTPDLHGILQSPAPALFHSLGIYRDFPSVQCIVDFSLDLPNGFICTSYNFFDALYSLLIA